jgi:RNA polymerase sigma-70 factor (ECF subfamily)
VTGDQLVERLRAGDEEAFGAMVERYHLRLISLAMAFVPNRAIAEEVVQDSWLAVVKGIDRFEGRSSLQTWLFSIVANKAKTAGVRERRTGSLHDAGPTVDPDRFGPDGAWSRPPDDWSNEIDDRLLAAGLFSDIRAAIDRLPSSQRQVLTLRDVEGLSGVDVCDVLGITEANQRVLLHRGRATIRRNLAQALGKE